MTYNSGTNNAGFGRTSTGKTSNDGGRSRTGRSQVGRVLTDAMWDKVQALVGRVDEVAHDMEIKWGIGRLPFLVEQEWAEKFYSQRRKFHNALHNGSPADVEVEGQRMMAAWRYLDQLATETGRRAFRGEVRDGGGVTVPVVEGLVDGDTVMMVVPSAKDAHWLAKWRQEVGDTRKAQVWAVEEILRLVGHVPQMATIARLKEVLGEAVVENVRMPPAEAMANFINDEIPF